MNVLVLNCGSSSIKFAVINMQTSMVVIRGIVDSINSPDTRISWEINNAQDKKDVNNFNYEQALNEIVAILGQFSIKDAITAVGHRVVHGGERFKESSLINEDILRDIENCVYLAPLHNPSNILGIKLMQQAFKDIPHVAVFDTAFHQSLPPHAYLYAIPAYLYEKHHVRRYGFHGISYRYVSQRTMEMLSLPKDNNAMIIAHLGNGCSVSAILNGKCQDTSMGMTPLEGLIMGTRSGDIDPGMISFFAKELNLSLDAINDLLNKKSGLLGVSALSQDMRTLEKASLDGHQGAQLAIEMFCYRLSKYILSFTAALPRIDAIVFTGGIGENSTLIRMKIMQRLQLLNVSIDPERNLTHGKFNNGVISTSESITVMVVPTNEELLIAQDTAMLL